MTTPDPDFTPLGHSALTLAETDPFFSPARKLLVVVAMSLGLAATAHAASAEAKPLPNIVLILADDMGYGDMGAYGSTFGDTPHLDQLAREGLRFTQFYANGAECSPTRTSFSTGRYSQRAGGLECAIGVGNVGRYPEALALSEAGLLGLPTHMSVIPDMFNEAGYHTALIGKWHLGEAPQFQPLAHGFDFSLGPIGATVDYFHHTEPVGEFLGRESPARYDFYRNGKLQRRDGYYLTDLFADEAVAYLNQQSEARPFFLYLPITSPHSPYQGPDDFRADPTASTAWGAGEKSTYREMVASLDDAVGKILAKLDAMGMRENTLVIFMSDNGPSSLGETGGLRAKKGEVFEGGIRVPLLLRWPGHIDPNTTHDGVFLTMDLTAAFANLVGFEPEHAFDGIDLLAHLDAPGRDRTVYWRRLRADTIYKAVRDGDLKYVHNTQGDMVEEFLFDLSNDPGEQIDLSAKHPEVFAKLRQKMVTWEASVPPERRIPPLAQ